jgi:flagellar biosynthetic protein FliR
MFPISIEAMMTGTLVFLRTGAVLFALPIIGDQPTPIQVRVLLAAAISLCVFPLLPQSWHLQATPDVLELALLVVKEILVGVALGFIARMTFDGILMAASMVGYQMGFGTANLFVPDAGAQMDGFTAFHRALVMLLFLGLNLHHIFIGGLVDTFKFIPPGGIVVDYASLASLVVHATASIFTIAIQLAAPILVALMFAMAALGLIARTVPQFNVFVLSFPASFFIGMLVYIASFPFYPEWMRSHVLTTHSNLVSMIRTLSP